MHKEITGVRKDISAKEDYLIQKWLGLCRKELDVYWAE